MGGPNATLTAQESVSANQQLMEKLGPNSTGMYSLQRDRVSVVNAADKPPRDRAIY